MPFGAVEIEYRDHTLRRPGFTVSVAPAACLQNRIQSCFFSEYSGKIKVNAGFNQGCGDDPTGFVMVHPLLDFFQDPAAVFRVHICGQMERPGKVAKGIIQVLCGLSLVDNA